MPLPSRPLAAGAPGQGTNPEARSSSPAATQPSPTSPDAAHARQFERVRALEALQHACDPRRRAEIEARLAAIDARDGRQS